MRPTPNMAACEYVPISQVLFGTITPMCRSPRTFRPEQARIVGRPQGDRKRQCDAVDRTPEAYAIKSRSGDNGARSDQPALWRVLLRIENVAKAFF